MLAAPRPRRPDAPRPPAAPGPAIGGSVSHYAVESELGRGAAGRVVLALDRRTGARVALKFLDPSLWTDPRSRERIERGTSAARRLDHPAIVKLLALEEADGAVFQVYEHVSGETLERRLERGPLEPAAVLRLAHDLAGALAHAHADGVVHRDLKPANVMAAADGSFKLVDFGVARIAGRPPITEPGFAIGTLGYAPPERIRGEEDDARGDLFSLGATLHEAMTGRRAFAGNTDGEVLNAIVHHPPSPIGDVDESLRALAEVVAALLDKDPARRPRAAALLQAFDAAAGGRAGERR
jgi:serine/threonine protein kinase